MEFTGITGGIIGVLMNFACFRLGNCYNVGFVGYEGIAFASGKTEQKWNRTAIILGLIAGKPGVADAGALGMSGESGTYQWNEIERITVDEGRRIISLHNNWRIINRIYCHEDNFKKVLAEFEKRLPKSKIVIG